VNGAEIRALAGMVDELDYYQLLQVARDAPGSRIRNAYHEASRRFHPDVAREVPSDVRRSIHRIAKRVTEAYSVLRDPRRRNLYDQKLSSVGQHKRLPLVEAQAEAGRKRREAQDGRTPNGRRYYALVRGDLSRGDRASALRNLRMALTFEPDNQFFKDKLDELSKR